MFGFIIGTVCLCGLVATVRRRRAWAFGYESFGFHRGFGHGYGPRHGFMESRCHGGFRRGGGHFARRGIRAYLRGLFMRLDTTPGQEKAILRAVDVVAERAREARGSVDATRREVAAVFAGDVLDQGAFQQVMTKQGEALRALSDVVCEALANVHEALDPEQRKELAELIAEGPFNAGYARRRAW